MSLPEFSVRQIVLVNILFVVLMVAGWGAATRIPVDLFPDISFNAAVIITVWSGASPQEVERLVTQKLENEIEDITGIKEISSYSSESLSEILIDWDETLSEIEYESAVADLRAALDRVDDLPEDAETPFLRELSVSEAFNICMVAVVDKGDVGEFTLREVARDLKDHLERIPGLNRADLRGTRDRELRVLADKYRLAQYDLTLADLHRVILENNQNVPGGSFTDANDQEIRVRGLGNFVSAEQLAQTVVKKDPGGSHVRLVDVAEIESGFAKQRMISRHNGDRNIMLGLSKLADKDIVDLVSEVRALIAVYGKTVPEGVELKVTWDGSQYVSARMNIMRNNLLLGVVFVVFILWLTLGFRNAMLAIVGVPFSFLVALILFPLFDITINSLSLVGFIMVSGMLVDDAIIILENIYRHVEEGRPLREAVVAGTEEVMWPVAAAIATTIAAFIPMLTVTGTTGEFMEVLPKTVTVCLLGSLLEALVILPAHYMDFGSRKKASESLSMSRQWPRIVQWSYGLRLRTERAIERLRERYIRGQRRVLAQRGPFLLMTVAALWFSFGVSCHVPVDLFPGDFNQIMVGVETPADFGLDQTDEVILGLEAALQPIRDELLDYSSYTGFSMTADENPVAGVNYGMIFISFPNSYANIANPDRVLRLVKDEMDQYQAAHPDKIVSLRVAPPRQGPPIGKPVAIRIQTDEYEQAKDIADQMKRALADIPGVYNIEDNLPVGPRELRVALDEHRASLHGLTFQDIAFALLAANDGVVPSTFKDPRSDEDVDIRVMLREDQRTSISDLLDVEVRTPAGYRVKLSDVVRIEVDRGYQRLYHRGTRRTVTVYADVDRDLGTSLSVNQIMQALFRDIPSRYPGVSVIFGGEYQETDRSISDLKRAFGIALLAIFGILAAQFRSYLQPLLVMSVIVFSFIGVIIGMAIMNLLVGGYALSFYVMYAMVGLAGIVVNDSLVLIDFINKARDRGASPIEAVVEGSRKRFRPILLTTVTTVTGLLPMAIGLTGYSRVFGPFATAIVFGLSVASLLTLFVVPTLYLTLEDGKTALAQRFGRVSDGIGGGLPPPIRSAGS